MKNRRVFISGGSGVIGAALVNSLLKQGAEILVGDLKPCPDVWKNKVKYFHGDLNTISVQELGDFDPEYFFHLAATFERTEENYSFYGENFHHNVLLSHYLMNCLKDCKSLQKVIFASSYLIYNPDLYIFNSPHVPVALHEHNSSIYPRNICGAAKLFHEIELRFFKNFLQKTFIMARIFRVYGRNSRDIISRWVRAALKNEPLEVFGVEGIFDYIFADDVAEGLLRLSKTSYDGVVNLGTGKSRSVSEVLNILKHYFPNLKVNYIKERGLYEASQADMKLFESLTHWLPEYFLESAIPELIHYEENKMDKY